MARAHVLWVCAVLAGAAHAWGDVPTDYDQYMLELVNRARAAPSAEAAADGIDLNEGLAPGTISSAAKQPLAFNINLNGSANGHSSWMLQTGTFSHLGPSGNTPDQRDQQAGYVFGAPWAWGENIAWDGSAFGAPDVAATTAQLHTDLFVDPAVAGRGHRVNMLNPAFREVGVGVVPGQFLLDQAVMATEDYAASGNNLFLTGVAFRDLAHTGFYSPIGEGLGGMTVTAVALAGGAVFHATTFSSGGYSLQLPSGAYDVTFSGDGLADQIFHDVVIGSSNVKLDLMTAASSHPWTNPVNALDVNNDHHVEPLDALIMINALTTRGPGVLPAPTTGNSPPPYLDPNGDNALTPADALDIINVLNTLGPSAQLALVPEPAGWILAAGGLMGLLGVARRCRSSRA